MRRGRITGLFTAFALSVVTVLPGAAVTKPVDVLAAGVGVVTVKTQDDLDKALTDRTTKKVVIKSDAVKLKIKKGNYSGIKLVVSSSKTKLVNAGIFRQITVKNASSFTEKARGNSIISTDSKLKIKVKKQAKNTGIVINKDNSTTDISVAGEVSLLEVGKAGCSVNVDISTGGVLLDADVKAVSTLNIKGTSEKRSNISMTADGASLVTSVLSDVTVSGKGNVTFEKGAENSSVKALSNASGVTVVNKTDGSIAVNDGTKTTDLGAGASIEVGDALITGTVSGNGVTSGNSTVSGNGTVSGNVSGNGTGNTTNIKAGARFATNLLKWYLVDTTTDTFEITPESADLQVVFYVRGDDGKTVKFDSLDVASSNEKVASVSWDQKANGKYYILTVYSGDTAGKTDITVKATQYKGVDAVKSEYKFTVDSKPYNSNIYDIEVGQTNVSLNNSPYAPSTDLAVKAVNSDGVEVDAIWETNVKFKGQDTSDVRADVSAKDGKLVATINALGAPGGTYRVELLATGEYGNDTKTVKKIINVQVTDVIRKVYPQGYSLSGKNIALKGNIADDISATYKVEVEELGITDYKGSNLSTKVRLAMYVGGKPIGYISDSGVEGFSAGWLLGGKALSRSGAFAGDPSKVDYELLKVYVYNGSNYYNNVDGDVLYLGQKQNTEFVTKDKLDSKSTIKAGGEISILSRTDKKLNEICYYGADSPKNNIAASGAYNVVIKYGNSFDDGKQLGDTVKLIVKYDLKMPAVEYNTSEKAELYVTSDVDLVRADDGYSVTYCAGKGKTEIKYPNYTFGKDKLSKGDKIYAVKVDDVRGGVLSDGAENADPGWLSPYPGAEDMKHKYSFDGGIHEKGVLIHFIQEKVVKITA